MTGRRKIMRRIAGGRFIYLGAIALFATVSPVLADIPAMGYIYRGMSPPFLEMPASSMHCESHWCEQWGSAFPITTTVLLSSLNLVVNFVGGSTQTFRARIGLLYSGSGWPVFRRFQPFRFGGTNPLPPDATLTGTFSPLTIDAGAGPVAIQPGFTTTISDSPNLVDGDFGIIGASPTSATPVSQATGSCSRWVCLDCWARRADWPAAESGIVLKPELFCFEEACYRCCACLLFRPRWARCESFRLKLLLAAACRELLRLIFTGSGFPSGTITPANVVAYAFPHLRRRGSHGTFSAIERENNSSCLDGSSGLRHPSRNCYRHVLRNSCRHGGGRRGFYDNCRQLLHSCQVTGSSAVLNACRVAGSSMGVLLPKGGAIKGNVVTAYVPRGYWSGRRHRCIGSEH